MKQKKRHLAAAFAMVLVVAMFFTISAAAGIGDYYFSEDGGIDFTLSQWDGYVRGSAYQRSAAEMDLYVCTKSATGAVTGEGWGSGRSEAGADAEIDTRSRTAHAECDVVYVITGDVGYGEVSCPVNTGISINRVAGTVR